MPSDAVNKKEVNITLYQYHINNILAIQCDKINTMGAFMIFINNRHLGFKIFFSDAVYNSVRTNTNWYVLLC